MLTEDATALWLTSWQEFVLHDWPGAWVNSLFRNEQPDKHLSSELIREAIAATRWHFGPPPPAPGMITFIDPAKTRRKRDPGRCYLRAGFRRVGETRSGLIALQMLPVDMPAPLAPHGGQLSLWSAPTRPASPQRSSRYCRQG